MHAKLPSMQRVIWSQLVWKQRCHIKFFCHLPIFLKKITFSKILTGIPSECQYVWPDLGLNCLQSEQPMTRPWLTHLHFISYTLNAFANRINPHQKALISVVRSGSTLFTYVNMIISDPTLMDLTSNFFVLCTNLKVYLCNYSGA